MVSRNAGRGFARPVAVRDRERRQDRGGHGRRPRVRRTNGTQPPREPASRRSCAVDRGPTPAEIAELEQALPDQPRLVAIVLTGQREAAGWWGSGRLASFHDAIEAAHTVLADQPGALRGPGGPVRAMASRAVRGVRARARRGRLGRRRTGSRSRSATRANCTPGSSPRSGSCRGPARSNSTCRAIERVGGGPAAGPGSGHLDLSGREPGRGAGGGRGGAGGRGGVGAGGRRRGGGQPRRCSRTCACSTSTPASRSGRAASRWPTRCASGRRTGR